MRKNEVTRRRMKSVQVSEAPQVSATCAIALSGARRGKRGGPVITSDGDPSKESNTCNKVNSALMYILE